MARLPRITVPGLPHHVTQRGNRRQVVFIEESDYAFYRDLLAQHFLSDEAEPGLEQVLAKGQSVGRPLMDDDQLVRLEKRMKRRLRPARRGRPRKIRREGRQEEMNVNGKASP